MNPTTPTRRTTVWTRVTAPGFHCWPRASGRRSYLAARHRHLFHITVHVGVTHSNRDVEFHDLQEIVRVWWGPGTRECGSSSCEDLAYDLWTILRDVYQLNPTQVEVSEDDESGAIVTGVS